MRSWVVSQRPREFPDQDHDRKFMTSIGSKLVTHQKVRTTVDCKPRGTPTGALILLAVVVFAGQLISGEIKHRLWRVAMETGQLGPVDTVLIIEQKGDGFVARSRSGALDLIRELPNLPTYHCDLGSGLFGFELYPSAEGFEGPVIAPWRDGKVKLRTEGDRISGSIDGGMFAGVFSGTPVTSPETLRDYPALIGAFDKVVADKIFNPDDLTQKDYLEFRETLGAIAGIANDDLDLLMGFKFAWMQKPFSHFQLRRFPAPAEHVIASFDGMNVGYEAARVEFEDDIAVLRVDTMMGNDTIEQINAAYVQIAAKNTKALVIDLRGNGGGAFAVKPLVEHVISEPLDAGYFISQKWNSKHDRTPTGRELASAKMLSGTSIIEFWKSVQEQPVLRVQFNPAEPHFSGPVYVLTDARSASATEMAVDALRASGRVTIIGEQTAGEMLSQSFFDVADGFVVSLPVADYYSTKHGRIEGVGVPVDIEIDPASALEKTKSLAKGTF